MGSKNIPQVAEELEIQYSASAALLAHIENWLVEQGAQRQAIQEPERVLYWDTVDNRLIREGLECRVKKKKKAIRVDLKTPINVEDRAAIVGTDGVLRRYEIKQKSENKVPNLSCFAKVALLAPVQRRVKGIFNNSLEPKFTAVFGKTKIEHSFDEGKDKGVVEFSLQHGYLETLDGARQTEDLYLVELELVKGSEEALHTAKRELEESFGAKPSLVRDRKIIRGFKLIEPEINSAARKKLNRAFKRHEGRSLELAAA